MCITFTHELYTHEGWRVSETKTKSNDRMFNFRLPADLDGWLGVAAERDHTSKADIIRTLILKAMRGEPTK